MEADNYTCSPFGSTRFNRCRCGRETVRKNSWFTISRDAFDQLSDEEKDNVFQDLYGVEEGIQETEGFIFEKLGELENELRSLPNQAKENYLLALDEEEKQGTNYVNCNKFRLMFLRADRFNVSLAAARIVQFFTEKKNLFGIEKLPRRIIQDDLDDLDKQALFSGLMYINDDLECFSRVVIVVRRENLRFKKFRNLKRAMFYYLLASIQDNEEGQKRGVVIINYSVEDATGFRRFVKKIRKHVSDIRKLNQQVLPARLAAYHHCCSNLLDRTFMALRLQFTSVKLRARCQQHYGSHTKCRSLLISYGVEINKLPVRANGEFKNKMLEENLENHRRKEQQMMSL